MWPITSITCSRLDDVGGDGMKKAIDWVFRNRETGAITVAQFPNVALWIFLGVFAVRLFGSIEDDSGQAVIEGGTRVVLDLIGFAALGWWSVDEIWRGVNPWRRFLGVTGACFTVVGLIDTF